ncbi:glycoside hydrolase superfamily, partial [Delphinella strobiligena]
LRMRSSLYTLAGAAASAQAAVRGFNYASQGQTYDTFVSQFQTAASLVGADDFTSARLYTMIQDATTNTVISAIPAAIATKTTLLLGVWASETQDAFDNELTALKNAISQYGSEFADLVVGISVGSEDLYRTTAAGIASNAGTGQTPAIIADYIGQVRTAIEGTVLSSTAVGHVDTWETYTNSSNAAVVEAADFLGLDEYPYYQTTDVNDVNNGSYLFFQAYDAVAAVAGGKPIWVTESGWPVSGSSSNLGVPSTANAEIYWQTVACELISRDINTWWYILSDSGASPSFGVTSAIGDETPLYNLACNSTS